MIISLTGCSEELMTSPRLESQATVNSNAANPRVNGRDLTASAWQPDLRFEDYTVADFVLPVWYTGYSKRLARVERRLARYQQQLRQNGDTEKLVATTETLQRVQRIDRRSGASASQQPRLHVVGLYQGADEPEGHAEVNVTDTSSPIVLCVCAHDSVRWTIKAGDDVQLKRIIVAGANPQSIAEAPAGVPVEGCVEREDAAYSFDAYARVFDWMYVDGRLRSLTGLAVSTRQGIYEYSGKPFVVGPENSDWLIQMKLQQLRPLVRDAMIFDALHNEVELLTSVRPMVSLSHNNAGVMEGGGGSSCAIATGSVFGPFSETLQTTNEGIHRLVHDPEFGFFTLNKSGICRVDPSTGQIQETDLPKLEVWGDWPLAADTTNNRLYAWGYELMCIDLKTGTKQVVRDGNSGSILSLAYCADRKCLYGISSLSEHTNTPIMKVQRLNLRGADVSYASIEEPIMFRGRPNICMYRNRLILTCRASDHRPLISYVIDPDTGRLIFATRCHPRNLL